MAEYRLYFVDDTGAIEAREEFVAPDDDVALIVADLVQRACSDSCYACELWQAERRVIAFDAARDHTVLAPTDEQTLAIQHITLTLEEALKGSRWRIARSEKLAGEMDLLRERSRALLARRRGP